MTTHKTDDQEQDHNPTKAEAAEAKAAAKAAAETPERPRMNKPSTFNTEQEQDQ